MYVCVCLSVCVIICMDGRVYACMCCCVILVLSDRLRSQSTGFEAGRPAWIPVSGCESGRNIYTSISGNVVFVCKLTGVLLFDCW